MGRIERAAKHVSVYGGRSQSEADMDWSPRWKCKYCGEYNKSSKFDADFEKINENVPIVVN